MKTRNMRRAVYFTHHIGIYGSETSLRHLLMNLPKTDVTLVAPRYLGPWVRYDPTEALKLFGPTVKAVHFERLPSYECYDNRATALKWRLYAAAENVAWLLTRRHIRELVRAAQPDYVHLNTLALAPLIKQMHVPCFLHLREIILPSKRAAVFRQLSKASGIICIDESTRAQLPATGMPPVTVITNPVDMTSVNSLSDAPTLCASYGLDHRRVIVSCIGRIIPIKGVSTVIRALRSSRNANLQLLVVGEGDPQSAYFQDCKRLADGDPRIRFLGEERRIERIYKLSDYVIRGDPDARLGRTVIEGLFAGCGVITPGTAEELRSFPELVAASRDGRTLLYPPQDVASLAAVFDCLEAKLVKGTAGSNVDEFLLKFCGFVEQVLQARGQVPSVDASLERAKPAG